MTDFHLDPRLQNDCSLLWQDAGLSVLLHHNAEVLWLILVPHSEHSEFYQLPSAQQQRLLGEINRLSDCLQDEFGSDKINVATIGNVVSQLHIHVIGRRHDDAYWPDVVWGKPVSGTHDAESSAEIRQRLLTWLELKGHTK